MNVAIIGFDQSDSALLERTMEGLIKEQYFLFNVLAGSKTTGGYKWAIDNGAPVVGVKSLEQCVYLADYVVIKDNEKAGEVVKLCKKFGKHGKVVGNG